MRTRPRLLWYLICGLSIHLTSRRLLWMYYELRALRAKNAEGKLSPVERLCYRLMSRRFPHLVARYGALLEEEADVGPDLKLPHGFLRIGVSRSAVIGARCTILPNAIIAANMPDHNETAPIIGDDVFIGAGAIIVGRCRIGDGARIGAGVTLYNATIAPGEVIINPSAYSLTHRRFVRRQSAR